jgi:tRNA 2-thiocytidine biosynthesis protein TtcA
MKVMLKGWDKQFPGRLETIFTSLQNVAPSQLADPRLFNFMDLKLGREAVSEEAMDELDSGLGVLAQ